MPAVLFSKRSTQIEDVASGTCEKPQEGLIPRYTYADAVAPCEDVVGLTGGSRRGSEEHAGRVKSIPESMRADKRFFMCRVYHMVILF